MKWSYVVNNTGKEWLFNSELPGNDNAKEPEKRGSSPGNDKPGRPKKSLKDKQRQVFWYLKNKLDEPSFFRLLKDHALSMEAQGAFSLSWHREEKLVDLESWIEKYLTTESRNRMLSAIRQQKVKTKNITVSEDTAFQLRYISSQVTLTVDEIIKMSLDLFQRKEMEKHREYKPIRGEKKLF